MLGILSTLPVIIYFLYIYKVGGFKEFYNRFSDIKYGKICRNCRKTIELSEEDIIRNPFVEKTKSCVACDRDLKIKGLVSNFMGNIKCKITKFNNNIVLTKKFDKLLMIILVIYIICLAFDLIYFFNFKKNPNIGTLMLSIYWALHIYRVRVVMK